MSALPQYAELRCLSNFSFLKGASKPEELVIRAKQLGYSALAMTDECTMAGIVRAHVQAKECGLKLLVGSQFHVKWEEPFNLVFLACNMNGYGNICEFITRLRRASETKGTYRLLLGGIQGSELTDCLVVVSPDHRSTPEQLLTIGQWALQHFIGRCWLGVEQLRTLDDEIWLYKLRQVSDATAIALVAVGDVHMHVRSRKPLQDVMTAIRICKPLTECGLDLQQNAERHLRGRLRLAQAFTDEVMAETLKVADRCNFSLDELKYQYPQEVGFCRDSGAGPKEVASSAR